MALKPLKVVVKGDTSGLERSMRRSSKAIKGLSVAASAAGAVVSGALTALTVQGLRAVDANVKLARSMDATINGLRAVQIAAGYSGVAVGEANSAMQQLNRELVRAGEEGSPAAEAIAKLGMNAERLSALDADDRMAAIADRVQELGLNSSQTADILRDLGVRSRNMTLLLLQGGDAIRSARNEVTDFGLELNTTQTNAIEAANDAIARMMLSLDGLRQRLTSEISPALLNVAERFSAFASSDAAQKAIERLGKAFRNLSETILSEDFIEAAVGGLELLAGTAAAVAEGMIVVSQNVEILAAGMSALTIAVAALGGPLTIVAGLLAGSLVAISKWRKEANSSKSASEEAAKGIEDLNAAMKIFSETGAPNAGAAALALAQNNVTLAESAYAAADAELEKAKAARDELGEAVSNSGGNTGLFRRFDRNTSLAQEEADAAQARLEEARSRLAEVQNQISNGVPSKTTRGKRVGSENTKCPKVNRTGGSASDVANDMQSRLDALTNGLMNERETLAQWREEGLETLRDAKEAELLTEEEYRLQREKLEKEHTERMGEIRDRERQSSIMGYKGMFGDLSTLMRSENEKLFKIGQAASIANATVSGLEAATEAWNKGMSVGGPITAAAFSGASLARTGALISQIASQSPRGGGGGGGSGGGGGASAAAPARPTQNVVIDMQNASTSQVDAMQQFADLVTEFSRQGGDINAIVSG